MEKEEGATPEDARAMEGPPTDHPFFHYYSMLVHQQNMLQDSVRTGTYRNAIIQNAGDFEGKVVLDVGTGTGILAFFAVQAGARKVYAVEASGIAAFARKLVAKNGMAHRIEVIEGKVEQIELPEQVDVIVSEPMGFLLVHERMLESYVVARQRFLRPGGLMMPTTGTIYACPFTDNVLWDEQVAKTAFWENKNFYDVDLSPLAEDARKHHLAQPVVGYFQPGCLLAQEFAAHAFDFGTAQPKDLQDVDMPLRFVVTRPALLHGLACWFDVQFRGSSQQIMLSTGPFAPGTHWYQCRLLLHMPLGVNAGQVVTGMLRLRAHDKQSHYVDLELGLEGTDIVSRTNMNLQDQMYHYLTSPAAQYYGQDMGGAQQ